MQKTTKILLAVFILLVILKIVLGLFITFPLGFADNYVYLKMANSFINEGSFFFDGIKYTLYPPGYSVLISPSFLAEDFATSFFIIKIINALISSTVIFASYLLARILFDRKKSVLISILISFFPPIFAIAFYPLSENLFYPLTLFGFYFFYKSIEQENILWDFLTGITLGLLYLTRMSAVFMIALIVLVAIYFIFKRNYKQFFKKIFLLFISLLVVLPWLFRNVTNLGFSLYGLLGRYGKTIDSISNHASISLFFKWFIYNITYISISTGVILVLSLIIYLFLKGRKKESPFFNLSLGFIGLYFLFYTLYTCTVDKPMGRYFAPIIPILILVGVYAIFNLKINKKISLFLSGFAIIFCLSFMLSQYSLFPINNMELSLIGALKILLIHFNLFNPLLFMPLFFCLPFILFLTYKIKPYYLITLILVFFIITNFLNYAIIVYDTNTRWENLETTKLAVWIEENIGSNEIIYLDMKDHMLDINGFVKTSSNEDYNETLLITTMLINNKIYSTNAKDLESGYLLSSYELNYDKIYSSNNSKLNLYILQ